MSEPVFCPECGDIHILVSEDMPKQKHSQKKNESQ